MPASPFAPTPLPPMQLDSLYSAHRGWLAHWLLRRLGNAFDAADLAQDTFARLLAGNLAQPQTPALRSPKAYLATVAKHLLINHLRRRSLEQAWLAALAEVPEQHAPSAEQQAEILQALQAVDAMLDGLKPKVRTVFIMAQIEGYPYAEIAARLGIGERSVKRYMAEALTECVLLA
ncbi:MULTISPECIES: sigma-70 family RNA polymerase sigma factor [unclassified Janthinobacterium]|uniref:sigma-70 family RNA polymerase sigma factor n=1 Tax=unclassified Janthinobacterium TaxID=2610881 RepID=UPI0016141072|nr:MULTISPECIES: sigma-70 family RNA polymerase sigma factor [unclassified Janthinobacterium]MBB5367657.1 RNA polymerase sigma-70 factor (ECF subfamily) [Janthinobacterium sp. K2C7]MBB5379865.1 RNA polymerase sigma-70 factor (ECF subfamily) [Janthinobacterium sp. K2Li3]MBB5386039.1 RNA polymerase sigma-70 factor (ECF subfamily) [Janthinobacterium sp. K2E3]